MNNDAKVSNFIDNTKSWRSDNLRNCMPDDIIDKISFIPILINTTEDKLA